MTHTSGQPPSHQTGWRTSFPALADAQVRLALLTAVALVLQAVIAKNVIDVEIDFMSQFAALWVFIVFQISGLRDRRSELAAAAAIVFVTAAVLVLYAV